MTAPLHAAWLAYLETVRWFGGKGAGARVVSIEPLGWWTDAAAPVGVRSEIATLVHPDGTREHYHLLVSHHPPGTATGHVLGSDPRTGADVVDATTDPAALAAFVAATAPRFADADLGVWGGEQSNTIVTLGSTHLYKVFRKVEPGPNLDVEVLVALGGGDVPRVTERLTAEWPHGTITDLGMVMERVPGATDGWVIATAACAAERDFTAEAHALGVALGGVHDALADAFGTRVASGDELATVMRRRLDAAVARADVLAPYADALGARFAALAGLEVATQRVHGDFHLGQTLSSPAGWTIIDFEGEPAKTAAERRAFDSRWRDVAGMVRSFDYARSAHADPSGTGAAAWAGAARTAFLDGYCGGGVRTDLLSAYEADKAIYEVIYEIRNRPDWVHIPLRAIRTIASGNHNHNTKEQ